MSLIWYILLTPLEDFRFRHLYPLFYCLLFPSFIPMPAVFPFFFTFSIMSLSLLSVNDTFGLWPCELYLKESFRTIRMKGNWPTLTEDYKLLCETTLKWLVKTFWSYLILFWIWGHLKSILVAGDIVCVESQKGWQISVSKCWNYSPSGSKQTKLWYSIVSFISLFHSYACCLFSVLLSLFISLIFF